MSFGIQALCLEYLIRHPKLETRVYQVPREIDAEVARLKLDAMKLGIDTLTPEQERYLNGEY